MREINEYKISCSVSLSSIVYDKFVEMCSVQEGGVSSVARLLIEKFNCDKKSIYSLLKFDDDIKLKCDKKVNLYLDKIQYYKFSRKCEQYDVSTQTILRALIEDFVKPLIRL